MKRVTLILMTGLLLCGGCRIAAKKDIVENKPPGLEVRGDNVTMNRKASGDLVIDVIATRDAEGNAVEATVIVRDAHGRFIKHENFGLTGLAIYPMALPGDQMSRDQGVQIDGDEVHTGQSKWSAWDSIKTSIIKYGAILAAITLGPLLIGGILCAFFPAGALNTLGLGLLKLNVFKLIGKLIPKKTPVADEPSNETPNSNS